MGLAQPTVQWEPDIPGKETGEARRKPPTQSNAKVKEIVQLNFYSAPMPSRQVIGWTLTFISSNLTHFVSLKFKYVFFKHSVSSLEMKQETNI